MLSKIEITIEPRTIITRSPKQGYQWPPQKRDITIDFSWPRGQTLSFKYPKQNGESLTNFTKLFLPHVTSPNLLSFRHETIARSPIYSSKTFGSMVRIVLDLWKKYIAGQKYQHKHHVAKRLQMRKIEHFWVSTPKLFLSKGVKFSTCFHLSVPIFSRENIVLCRRWWLFFTFGMGVFNSSQLQAEYGALLPS